MDEIDPHDVKYKPTIAIESSPGRFVGLWMLDKTMNEGLNRRLSYAIDADKGGWDLSQVLRIPGTRNYKYQSTPQVRLLWDDGPTYKVSDLERRLPEDEAGDEEAGEDLAAIYKKYDKTMSASTKHELMKGKPTQGKRSEVLWRLVNELVEAGVARDHAFAMLKHSPWNKFAGRHSEDHQLNRELDKVYKKKFLVKVGSGEEKKNGYKMLTKSMEDVEERKLDWIWYPYLARGEITLLEGDPGIGKSFIMNAVAKAICDGDRLPCSKAKYKQLTQGVVAYFDMENDAGAVTKMRLKWNGCQNMKNFFQEEEPFTMDDEDKKNAALEAIEKLSPTMVVFDTLNHYIGRADIAKSNEATNALQIFGTIAKRYNCAVVLIRHLTKSGGVKAMYRGQGNIAISARPRIIMTIGNDPEDEEGKALCVTKLSFAPTPGGIRFNVVSLPDTLKEEDRAKVTWGEYDAKLKSDDIIDVEKKDMSGEKDAAKDFLEDVLGDGPVKKSEIEIMAEKRAISKRTLERAADALGVVKKLTGFGSGKTSTWELARMTQH